EVAVQQYAIAKRNAEGTTDAIRYRIAEGCGEALMLLGRYEDANQQLAGVLDLVADSEKTVRIEVLQGEIAFKQGAIIQSIAHYEEGLRRLGNWVPRSVYGVAYGILRESGIQCVHSLIPWWLHRGVSTSRRELTVRFFYRLSVNYIFQNTPKMLWSHL